MRSEFNIDSKQKINAYIDTSDFGNVISSEIDLIKSTSMVDHIEFAEGPKSGTNVNLVINGADGFQIDPVVIVLPLDGIVNIEEERKRVSSDLAECQNNIARLTKLVSNENFISKADPEVVNNEIEKLRANEAQRERLEQIAAQLEG